MLGGKGIKRLSVETTAQTIEDRLVVVDATRVHQRPVMNEKWAKSLGGQMWCWRHGEVERCRVEQRGMCKYMPDGCSYAGTPAKLPQTSSWSRHSTAEQGTAYPRQSPRPHWSICELPSAAGQLGLFARV